MSLGCPVISSNHEAIVEAVGSAAKLFDPSKPEDIAIKMKDVLYSDDTINDLKSKGLQRSKVFTWEKCANKLWKFIIK